MHHASAWKRDEGRLRGPAFAVDEFRRRLGVSLSPRRHRCPRRQTRYPRHEGRSVSASPIPFARRGATPVHGETAHRRARLLPGQGRQYCAPAAWRAPRKVQAVCAGHGFRAGQNPCLVRWMEIRRTDDEALERFRSYHLDIWKNFYAAMSRRQVEDGNYLGSLIKFG